MKLATGAAAIEAEIPWLSLLVVIAALGALVVWAVPAIRRLALAFGIVLSTLIFGLFLVAAATGFDVAKAGQVQMAETYAWVPEIGISLAWGVNGMGLVMIGLATFLVPLVLLAAKGDFADEDRAGAGEGRAGDGEARAAAGDRAAGYVGWTLVLEAIMVAIFSARDLFLFYILFELMILPVYFLVGRYGGKERHRVAIKFVLYSLLGGLVMLVGVIGVVVNTRVGEESQRFLIDNLAADGAFQGSQTVAMWLFVSFFFGFAIKAPMFPVHTWLPDTTAQAQAGTSTLLVGVLDKLGTYGMIALCLPLFPQAARQAAVPVMILAVVSIFWGAFMALASRNIMRLIAYTSVSHFGFIVLGIFSGSQTAMTGAIAYMVAHGVATGALFLTASFLARRSAVVHGIASHDGQAYDIEGYGGWQRVTPLIAGVFLVSGLATVALPGLSGFVPEFLVLAGTFESHGVLAGVAVFGVILAALYILLPYQKIFTGPKPEVEVADLDGGEKTVAGVLVAAMLALGFLPGPMLDAVRPVAADTAGIVAVVAEEGSAK